MLGAGGTEGSKTRPGSALGKLMLWWEDQLIEKAANESDTWYAEDLQSREGISSGGKVSSWKPSMRRREGLAGE